MPSPPQKGRLALMLRKLVREKASWLRNSLLAVALVLAGMHFLPSWLSHESALPLKNFVFVGSKDNFTLNPLRVYLYPIHPSFNFELLKSSKLAVQLRTTLRVDQKWLQTVEPGMDIPVFGTKGTPVALHAYSDDLEALPYSAEYWVTLSLLSGLKSVTVVNTLKEAEIIFLPIFSSLAFHMHEEEARKGEEGELLLQRFAEEVVEAVKALPQFPEMESRLLIPAVHPLALFPEKQKLPKCRYLLSDVSHASPYAVKLDKDVIVPLAPSTSIFVHDNGAWENRPQLGFFRGELRDDHDGEIRSKLVAHLTNDFDFDVHSTVGVEGGSTDNHEINGMRTSKFCFVPAGNYPTSRRLFNAILSGCLPVIISDHIELPFEDIIDYSKFAYFIPLSLATEEFYLREKISLVTRDEWYQRWLYMRQVQHMFEFGHPDLDGGAEDMIWQAVGRKMRGVDSFVSQANRSRRRGRVAEMLLRESKPVLLRDDDDRPHSDY